MSESIVLKNQHTDMVTEEAVPAAAFYPGHLIEFDSDGKMQKHSTSGGNVTPKMFAVENSLEGEEIDDGYTTSDRATAWIPLPGDEVYAILADGENASRGDKLESNGDGTLKVHASDTADSDDSITVYPNQIVGIAQEAKNLSTSSGVETANTFDSGYDQRIKIMIV